MAEENRDLLIELMEEIEAGRIKINNNFHLTDKKTGLEVDLNNLKIINSPVEECHKCKEKVKEWYRSWHSSYYGDEYSFIYCLKCCPAQWGNFDKNKEKWWSKDKFLN
ncbi:hypothetical protein [endosymbiont GvMRE of Glomus versiforme]|uniref:hypothetical protein n=1 Tax=endosymbiont GvMRE of Glomus versiforme TaxID=2039283 RepID=UPI000EB8A497|nr:hypothetical protein [endosymbiont GvMRE of Glomus versiforme]RHZ37435.1 hypothetical protein GvMRE_I1g554 [endosymbiont GvMRE of Glomus versiforme]